MWNMTIAEAAPWLLLFLFAFCLACVFFGIFLVPSKKVKSEPKPVFAYQYCEHTPKGEIELAKSIRKEWTQLVLVYKCNHDREVTK